MKNTLLTLCLLIVSIVGFAAPTGKQPLPSHYTPEEKIYAMSLLWSELKYNFVHIDRLTFDIDSLYKSYLPRILNTQNDVEFFDLLKRFVANFNDGHTSVGQCSYAWNDAYDFAPMLFDEIDGRIYISRLWQSSGLDSLALGAELIQIEEIPTQEYLEKQYLPLIPHGSKRAKLLTAAKDYVGSGMPNSRFNATLKYRDGRIKQLHIDNNFNELKSRNANGRMWYWKGFMKSRKAPVTLEWLNNDIAWIDFRSFNMESIPILDSMIMSIKQYAAGLIFDLRYCPGGSSPVGDHLLKYLVDADTLLCGAAQARIANGYMRSQGNWRSEYVNYYKDRAYETIAPDTIIIDRTKRLQCPIIILIDKYTASAAETFLVQLMEAEGRPRIIGSQTEGSTGSPLVIDLPHDAWVRICTLRHLFPKSGKVFDSIGIMPDEVVIPRVEDYFTGYDRVLNRAIEKIIK